MTIASEISRLQCAKADIKTAIENKGVTVGSSDTLDGYASCIDEIQQGSSWNFIDFLLVGGGGSGGADTSASGGGGAGGFIECCRYNIGDQKSFNIVIGNGGTGAGRNGGNSCLGSIVAYGGGGGGCGCTSDYNAKGKDGGSGGGAGSSMNNICYYMSAYPGNPYDIRQGNSGGYAIALGTGRCMLGGGGGGAGAAGCDGGICVNTVGRGGSGLPSTMSGACCRYAGGGAGGGCNRSSSGGQGGGGDTRCNATYYGGGGGAICGSGCQGIAIVRYTSDGSYGINCATGGTVTTCTVDGSEYKIHTFTSNGTFCIVC